MSARYFLLRLSFDEPCKEALVELLYELEVGAFQEGDAGVLEPADGDVPGERSVLCCYFDSLEKAEAVANAARAAAGTSLESATISVVDEAAWIDEWKKFAEPVEISDRLMITPCFVEPARTTEHRRGAEREKVVVALDPGRAFGSGSHETTRLCLKLIDGALRKRPSASLLDVGCGSGILAIAAALLGAQPVVGIDIDPEAIVAASENAERNGADCTFSCTPLAEVEGRFDIVAANILSSALRELWEALLLRLADGGLLILSGILVAEQEEFIETVIRPATTRQRGGPSTVRAEPIVIEHLVIEQLDIEQLGEWTAIALRAGRGGR